MNRCRLCVIPDTRPDTAFIDGVCSACIAYHTRPTIDWDARRLQLIELLERHSGRCIVPSSGGKDSTYQVLRLIELGAKPLVVTASTCHLTPIGRRNIDNLGRFAPTIEVTPNRTRRAKLNRLALEMVGDISWPEHVSIFTTPFVVAAMMDVKLIFYGENPQAEYGGPTPDSQAARTMTRRWVSEFGGFLGLRPSDFEAMGYEMHEYQPPSAEILAELGIEAHFLGQYEPWDSERNAQKAMANGFATLGATPANANWWEWENLDNAQTGLHDHVMYRKYGYGRGAAQISVDIRAGRVSRDFAMGWIQDHDGRYPYAYAGVPLDAVLERIDMTKEQLWDVLDQFTNWELFSRTDRHADGVPYLVDR